MNHSNIMATPRFYINWTRLVITCIIPVISLIGLNMRIFRGIRFSHIRSKNSAKKEVNLAFILICIVFVFIFSNIPRVFLNCYEFIMSADMLRSALPLLSSSTT